MAVSARDQIEQTTASAGAVARRLARRFSGRQDALVTAAPGIVEIVLAIAIGAILLTGVFSLLAPLPVPTSLPERIGTANTIDAPVAMEQTPFRIAAIEAVAPELVAAGDDYEETKLDLKLHGVYTLGDTPSAFITTPDGIQMTFRVGEEIWKGVTLAAVQSDYVVIVTGGVRETLTLENRDLLQRKDQSGQRQRQGTPVPALRNDTKVDNATGPSKRAGALGIGDAVLVSVQPKNGKLRMLVRPGANRAAFDASGLKSGDVIVAVNNRRVGDVLSEAKRFASLSNTENVTLLIERDGISLPIDLKLSANGESDSTDE